LTFDASIILGIALALDFDIDRRDKRQDRKFAIAHTGVRAGLFNYSDPFRDLNELFFSTMISDIILFWFQTQEQA